MSEAARLMHLDYSPAKIKKLRAAISHVDQVKAERCRRSFFYFMQEFWDEICTDTPYWNWHIRYLCKQLTKMAEDVADGKPKAYDLIINIPPGTTKSITCTVMFPVWCWTRWYWMRFIAGSYSGMLSLEHAEYSRDIVRSDKFQRLFPELEIKQDKDKKSNFRIQKKIYDKDGNLKKIALGGNRFSTSVGGTLTGYHAHIQIVDDPIDPKKAVSEVELKSTNYWIDQTLSTRKVDKAITPLILIMQRLHEEDPTGHLLDKTNKKFFHICLPGESRQYREDVKPRELIENYKDDLLDPIRMDWNALEELESDLGQYGYAGQIGQKPTPPSGGMFKVDHFQIINIMPPGSQICQTVRYWDKAGTAKGGAYTVGTKIHKLWSGKFIISDVKRGQWGTDERENIIKETAQADDESLSNKISIYVEQEPGSGGKESAESTIKNLAGHSIFADLPKGDKIFRADPYSVQVNNGNIMLLKGEWNKYFIDEHRFFPFSKYKDQVDSAAAGFARLSRKKQAGKFLR